MQKEKKNGKWKMTELIFTRVKLNDKEVKCIIINFPLVYLMFFLLFFFICIQKFVAEAAYFLQTVKSKK